MYHSEEQVRHLLDLILKSSEKQYALFCKALEATNQGQIAELLLGHIDHLDDGTNERQQVQVNIT